MILELPERNIQLFFWLRSVIRLMPTDETRLLQAPMHADTTDMENCILRSRLNTPSVVRYIKR